MAWAAWRIRSVAGFEAFGDEVVADLATTEAHFTIDGGAEQDGIAAGLLLEGIDQGEELILCAVTIRNVTATMSLPGPRSGGGFEQAAGEIADVEAGGGLGFARLFEFAVAILEGCDGKT